MLDLPGLCCGGVLCIAAGLAASLVFTHQVPVPPSLSPSCDTQQSFQAMPSVSWGINWPRREPWLQMHSKIDQAAPSEMFARIGAQNIAMDFRRKLSQPSSCLRKDMCGDWKPNNQAIQTLTVRVKQICLTLCSFFFFWSSKQIVSRTRRENSKIQ